MGEGVCDRYLFNGCFSRLNSVRCKLSNSRCGISTAHLYVVKFIYWKTSEVYQFFPMLICSNEAELCIMGDGKQLARLQFTHNNSMLDNYKVVMSDILDMREHHDW